MFKTLKSYIKAIEVIEKQSLCDLKGYEKLTPQKRELLGLLSASISNCFNEFLDKDYYEPPDNREGPKPIATFHLDTPEEVRKAKKAIGIKAVIKVFGLGGKGVEENCKKI